MSNIVDVKVSLCVDLDLLREQKQALIEACDENDQRDKDLIGLVYLIDSIQDQIVCEFDNEEDVFGKGE